jgi:hypothetical protein
MNQVRIEETRVCTSLLSLGKLFLCIFISLGRTVGDQELEEEITISMKMIFAVTGSG